MRPSFTPSKVFQKCVQDWRNSNDEKKHLCTNLMVAELTRMQMAPAPPNFPTNELLPKSIETGQTISWLAASMANQNNNLRSFYETNLTRGVMQRLLDARQEKFQQANRESRMAQLMSNLKITEEEGSDEELSEEENEDNDEESDYEDSDFEDSDDESDDF